jgi:hypothetical protein
MTIEERMKSHGLSVKVVQVTSEWKDRPAHLVRSIAKNPNNSEEVRNTAFDELDRRKKAQVKT